MRLCSFVFMYFLVSGQRFSVVDMYNATSNSWTSFPNGLVQAREYLAGASLPSGLVFFAGGYSGRRLFDYDSCFLLLFVLLLFAFKRPLMGGRLMGG